MNSVLRWLTAWSAGDFVSASGLAIAIWQIVRAKRIAEQVRTAVGDVRRELERKTIAIELNELIRELEELKEISRSSSAGSELFGRRFTAIRIKLIRIRSRHPAWTPKQRAVLQDSVTTLLSFEALMDVSDGVEKLHRTNLRLTINKQIDRMAELLSLVQNEGRRAT